MRPSIARISEQLDSRFAASRHTTAPISHTRPNTMRVIRRKRIGCALSRGVAGAENREAEDAEGTNLEKMSLSLAE